MMSVTRAPIRSAAPAATNSGCSSIGLLARRVEVGMSLTPVSMFEVKQDEPPRGGPSKRVASLAGAYFGQLGLGGVARLHPADRRPVQLDAAVGEQLDEAVVQHACKR